MAEEKSTEKVETVEDYDKQIAKIKEKAKARTERLRLKQMKLKAKKYDKLEKRMTELSKLTNYDLATCKASEFKSALNYLTQVVNSSKNREKNRQHNNQH